MSVEYKELPSLLWIWLVRAPHRCWNNGENSRSCSALYAAVRSRNPAGEQLLEQQGARTCWALRGEVWEIEIVPLELQPRSLLKFLDHKSDLGRKCQCTFFFLLLDKLVFIKWSLLMPWSCACLGFLQLNFFFFNVYSFLIIFFRLIIVCLFVWGGATTFFFITSYMFFKEIEKSFV